MSDAIKAKVKQQFSASAEGYLTSQVHAKGSDLPLLPELAGLTGQERVLDVATAAGHTALALAPHAREVIGVDLTPAMLAVAQRQAEEKGLRNVSFVEADAEDLSYPDQSFDVLTCRIAAHHFPNLAAFCAEAARVLKPGGRLLVVDNVVPEEPEQDRFINELEKLRDPSHFRAYRLSEWEQRYRVAGFSFTVAHQFTTSMDLEEWLTRMNVPEPTAVEVRRRLAGAPSKIRDVFAITETGFQLYKAIMVGVRH